LVIPAVISKFPTEQKNTRISGAARLVDAFPFEEKQALRIAFCSETPPFRTK
jgi:hypothetical protein